MGHRIQLVDRGEARLYAQLQPIDGGQVEQQVKTQRRIVAQRLGSRRQVLRRQRDCGIATKFLNIQDRLGQQAAEPVNN